MTVLEGIRKGGATQVLNRAFTGMVVDKWNFTLGKGPGRANSKIEIDLVGTGKVDEASSLAMPAKTPTHLLPAASLTCTINGTDYVTARTFESAQFTWDNNLREGYYPGIRLPDSGRSDERPGPRPHGIRQAQMRILFRRPLSVRVNRTRYPDCPDRRNRCAGLTGGAGFEATLTLGQSKFKTSKIDNTDGIVTVRVDISAQVNPTVGLASLVTITANNALGGVGRA
jgi:hypothetical protein